VLFLPIVYFEYRNLNRNLYEETIRTIPSMIRRTRINIILWTKFDEIYKLKGKNKIEIEKGDRTKYYKQQLFFF
jgi:hypothetical protein